MIARRPPSPELIMQGGYTARLLLLLASTLCFVGSAALLSFAPLTLPWLIPLLLLPPTGLGLAVVFRVATTSGRRLPDLGEQAEAQPVDDALIADARLRIGSLSADAALIYLRRIVEPQRDYPRLTEVAKPLTRSIELTTTLSVRLAAGEGPHPVMVPLIRRRRGQMEEGLTVTDSDGNGLKIVPRPEQIAYDIAAVDRVVRSMGVEAIARFREHIRGPLVEVLAARLPPDEPTVTALRKVLRSLNEFQPGLDPDQSDPRVVLLLGWLNQVIFADQVCVVVPVRGAPTIDEPSTAAPGVESQSDDWTVAAQVFEATFTVRRRTALRYNRTTATKVEQAADVVRTFLGIQALSFTVALDHASRAASYHLEISGPERCYLSRQELRDPDGQVARPDGFLLALPRLGQRHGHLHLRAGQDTTSWSYRTEYLERMPSAVAPAAISATALAALLGLGWLSLVTHASSAATPALVGTAAYSGLLIGVPSAVAVWSGLQADRKLQQPGLIARFGTAVTILLALIASAASLLTSSSAASETAVSVQTWSLLTLLSIISACYLIVSWIARGRLAWYFLSGGQELQADPGQGAAVHAVPHYCDPERRVIDDETPHEV